MAMLWQFVRKITKMLQNLIKSKGEWIQFYYVNIILVTQWIYYYKNWGKIKLIRVAKFRLPDELDFLPSFCVSIFSLSLSTLSIRFRFPILSIALHTLTIGHPLHSVFRFLSGFAFFFIWVCINLLMTLVCIVRF